MRTALWQVSIYVPNPEGEHVYDVIVEAPEADTTNAEQCRDTVPPCLLEWIETVWAPTYGAAWPTYRLTYARYTPVSVYPDGARHATPRVFGAHTWTLHDTHATHYWGADTAW